MLEGKQVFRRCTNPSSLDLPDPVRFDDLPDELVIKIFSNLSTKDLLTKVARVSKRFHSLSQDQDVHVQFKFGDYYFPWDCPRTQRHADAAIKFLKGKNKIHEVEMACPEFPSSLFKLAVMDQKKTTSLCLGGDYSNAFELLRNSPEKAKQIQTLELAGTNEDCIDWEVPEFVNLINFAYFGDCGSDNSEESAESEFVWDIAMKSEKLESINARVQLSRDKMMKLFDRHGNQLKSLYLESVYNWYDLWDIGIPQMKFKNLEHISIDGGSLFTDSVISIIQLESLKTLHIDMLCLSPDLLTRAVSLVNNNKLEYMELFGETQSKMTFKDSCITLATWECDLTPDDLSDILMAATRNEHVKKLHIYSHTEGYFTWLKLTDQTSSTELLLDKGKKFYLKTCSSFMPKEKLAKLIGCLPLSLPPKITIKIIENAALAV